MPPFPSPQLKSPCLAPESYCRIEVMCQAWRECICRRNRKKTKGNFVFPYADTCIIFPSWVLESQRENWAYVLEEDSWINIFPNREAHRNFEVFIKELIMRRKLFENRIKKYLPNCFNNLTLESQDSPGIERIHFSLSPLSLVYLMHAESSDGLFLGVGGEMILFLSPIE